MNNRSKFKEKESVDGVDVGAKQSAIFFKFIRQ